MNSHGSLTKIFQWYHLVLSHIISNPTFNTCSDLLGGRMWKGEIDWSGQGRVGPSAVSTWINVALLVQLFKCQLASICDVHDKTPQAITSMNVMSSTHDSSIHSDVIHCDEHHRCLLKYSLYLSQSLCASHTLLSSWKILYSFHFIHNYHHHLLLS